MSRSLQGREQGCQVHITGVAVWITQSKPVFYGRRLEGLSQGIVMRLHIGANSFHFLVKDPQGFFFGGWGVLFYIFAFVFCFQSNILVSVQICSDIFLHA